MHILIDVRALMDSHISGVAVYTKHIVAELTKHLTSEDQLTLWYNSSRSYEQQMHRVLGSILVHPQVTLLHTKVSNKWFALTAKLPMAPRFEQWLLKHSTLTAVPDILFMPDVRPLFGSNIPLVTTIHDMSFFDWPQGFSYKTQVWHQLLSPKTIIRRSKHIIAVSQFTKQRVILHTGLSPDRVTVIYEDASFGTPEVCPVVDTPVPYFVTLCTLEPRKNLLFTIEEFLHWNSTQEHPYQLYVLGGVNSDIFREVALPKDPHVIYKGVISEEEKIAYLTHAQALLYLSRYEGFGLPPVEAMKCGTPPIVSSAGSLPEIVGDAGLVVSPIDGRELHAALSQIIDPETQKNLRDKAKAHGAQFSWEQAGRETMDVLRRCLH